MKMAVDGRILQNSLLFSLLSGKFARRFSSSSAAMAGEISDAPNSGSVADRSCAKLAFVILRCFENVYQLLVSDVIPVLAEFLVGCTFGPAGSGFSLSVLHDFDDGTLCSDVAFHGARDLAADHGLQRRHFRDCFALTDSKQTIDFLPDERLGTLSFAMPPFSGWIAGLPFAETGVNRRFAVPDRGAALHRRLLFLRVHRLGSSAVGGSAARSCAASSKPIPLAA
jgi:hypothetical protein